MTTEEVPVREETADDVAAEVQRRAPPDSRRSAPRTQAAFRGSSILRA